VLPGVIQEVSKGVAHVPIVEKSPNVEMERCRPDESQDTDRLRTFPDSKSSSCRCRLLLFAPRYKATGFWHD
jgi:hypothetical protein